MRVILKVVFFTVAILFLANEHSIRNKSVISAFEVTDTQNKTESHDFADKTNTDDYLLSVINQFLNLDRKPEKSYNSKQILFRSTYLSSVWMPPES